MPEDPTKNPDNRLVSELRVIRYIDAEGTLNTIDLSQGAFGAELEEHEYDNLISWASAFAVSAKVAAILAANNV